MRLTTSRPKTARDDVARVREHYRHQADAYAQRFARQDPVIRWSLDRLIYEIQSTVQEAGLDIKHAKTLEVGCGSGQILSALTEQGLPAQQALGVDLIVSRLQAAKQSLPAASFCLADGAHLPLRVAALDLVFAVTTFSSMPSRDMRRLAAQEILRILRPGGALLYYDAAWKNPRNRYTVSMSAREVRALFDVTGAHVRVRRVTVNPLLRRALSPLGSASIPLLSWLERWPPLRSHLLALVIKPRGAAGSLTHQR